ncbi:TPA: restriction endonuclease [Streptococcus suis]|jgi:type II restriction enzyme|nr:restriction endonuclease [Streptococcus suis]HEM3642995.1 restriction endonuclease [Streptococcus suis]
MRNFKHTEDQPRWIFKKHTNNMNLLLEVATYLKNNKSNISIEDKERMFDILSNKDNYNPRKSLRNKPLDSLNHRLDELRYYMFGYYDKIDGVDKFMFSPLGNLFLKNILSDSQENMEKIFLTMLYAVQFPHIGSQPSWENFSLYPFRLMIKLLREPQLGYKLYHSEVVMILMFVQKMNDTKSYNDLVSDIIELRNRGYEYIFNELLANQFYYVTLVYEWEYYVSVLLAEAGVIIKRYDGKEKFVKLAHKQKIGSKSPATFRKATNGFFELNSSLVPLADELLEKYTIFDLPLMLDDCKSLSSDIVKEIYSFYPKELLISIGEEVDDSLLELLSLPKLIEQYSKNENNKTSDLFEDVLVEAFNLFINVEAEKRSGAGQTDIECLFIPLKEIFAVEAKSTQNKLSLINAGRLRKHRNQIGARYTVLVTPRYVPSVKYDIQGQEIVIIKANTLSEYFYNGIISKTRELDYSEFREIITNNLGTDISRHISELTLSKFG